MCDLAKIQFSVNDTEQSGRNDVIQITCRQERNEVKQSNKTIIQMWGPAGGGGKTDRRAVRQADTHARTYTNARARTHTLT